MPVKTVVPTFEGLVTTASLRREEKKKAGEQLREQEQRELNAKQRDELRREFREAFTEECVTLLGPQLKFGYCVWPSCDPGEDDASGIAGDFKFTIKSQDALVADETMRCLLVARKKLNTLLLVKRHVKEVRITEWPVEFLRYPRRTAKTIPDFLSPNAPSNRLDILRGLAKPE